MFSHLRGSKGDGIAVILALFFISLLHSSPLSAITVDQLKIVAKYSLTNSGYSPDLALHPVDGTLHIAWVDRFGNIHYKVRNINGTWNATQTVPDGGRFVVGLEEPATNEYTRKCIGLAIDEGGLSHIVFSDNGGDLFYLNGHPGNWSTPVCIVEKGSYSIWTDIAVANGVRFVTYEDEGSEHVYTVMYRGGKWENPVNMGYGEYPSLTLGSENRVYLIYRDYGNFYNVQFWYITAGESFWHYVSNVTNAEVRLGHGPALAVYNDKMYIAWSNSNPAVADEYKKGELFVASSEEPGLIWNHRLGGNHPVFYENTGDNHNRVAIYSDNTVIHMNGARNERYQIWDGSTWSATRNAPWNDGSSWTNKLELEVVCDGKNAWVITSIANFDNGEVALYGIQNPNGEVITKPTVTPVDKLETIAKRILDPAGYSCDIAINPVSGTLQAAWVNNGDINFASRQTSGSWSAAETISDGGMTVYGSDQSVPRNCLGIDVDRAGLTHLVYSVSDGDVYYLNGTSGHWNSPQLIVDKNGSSIFPDIVSSDGILTIVYEDAETNKIYGLRNSGNTWSAPELIGNGDYPFVRTGSNGRIYLAYRSTAAERNAVFGYQIPGYTPWTLVSSVTNAENGMGGSPAFAVAQSKIYLAWNNNTGEEFSDYKSQLFCAQASEPGSVWNSKFDSSGPLYYENTSDPHTRVEVYSDGELLYLNGKRLSERFILWDKDKWSQPRTGPWVDGIPSVVSDGKTIWIGVSSTSVSTDEVSVTGIRNPDASVYNYTNHWPVIASTPGTSAVEGSLYTYQTTATDADSDPISYQLLEKPDGMTISAAGLVQWTPASAQRTQDPWNQGSGIHLVGIKAADNKGSSDCQFFWIQVTPPNTPPEITSSPVTTVELGESYSYAVLAQDQDGEALTYSLTSAPAAMTIGLQTGLILWTPQPGDLGNHSVTIKVTDPRQGSDTQTFVLQVVDEFTAPVALFSAEPAVGIYPLEVHFTNQSTGTFNSALWDFGDLQTSTNMNPVHTYMNAGTFSVRLVVDGEEGADTLSVPDMIHVNQRPPVAGFTGSPLSGILPLTVQFTDTSKGVILTYSWNFGDGAVSSLRHPQHVYSEAGYYPVSLKVTGPGGADSVKVENFIQVNYPKPLAMFSVDTTMGEPPFTVQFINESQGEIDSCLWSFGDGNTSTDLNAEHQYLTEGDFTVSLIVFGPGGGDTLKVEQLIHVHVINSVSGAGLIPDDFHFYPNAPNPFNPSTLIVFDLPRTSDVQIRVFNLRGHRVAVLEDDEKQAGQYSLIWDGTDDSGQRVPSGIYFIVMEAGEFRAQQKALFMK